MQTVCAHTHTSPTVPSTPLSLSKQVARPEQPARVSSLPPMPDSYPGPSFHLPPCVHSLSLPDRWQTWKS